MERVKVTVVCDRCQQDTELQPGSGLAIVFGGLASEVDLCERCHNHLLVELEELIGRGRTDDSARTRAKTPFGRRPRDRVLCDKCGSYFRDGSGITLHRLKKHAQEEGEDDYAEATG
jgi:hypothetical protein